VGDHVRARRLDLRLTQAEAAEYIGVSEAAVYEWEKYGRSPSSRHWPAIIAWLGYYPCGETTLAEKLVAYRRQHGLSQGELALYLSVDEGAVRKWEQRQELKRRGLRARVEALLVEEKLEANSLVKSYMVKSETL
jgi:DNA-binding transcriptional regulator YiaG